jgi:hypothetical protein
MHCLMGRTRCAPGADRFTGSPHRWSQVSMSSNSLHACSARRHARSQDLRCPCRPACVSHAARQTRQAAAQARTNDLASAVVPEFDRDTAHTTVWHRSAQSSAALPHAARSGKSTRSKQDSALAVHSRAHSTSASMPTVALTASAADRDVGANPSLPGSTTTTTMTPLVRPTVWAHPGALTATYAAVYTPQSFGDPSGPAANHDQQNEDHPALRRRGAVLARPAALIWPGYRRAALTSAAVAGSSAVAGALILRVGHSGDGRPELPDFGLEKQDRHRGAVGPGSAVFPRTGVKHLPAGN